jgi:transposase
MHCNSVNHWVKRYKSAGLAGLVTRHGRGRKPKLNKAEHGEQARKSVEKYRQRMLAAKADFEAESGKEVSRQTLRRFLKSLVEDTNASEDA